MTRISVFRILSDADSTISRILVDTRPICVGLEDEHRDEKVAGKTRIAAGTYPVKLRTFGGFHERYSERFPDFHEGMLEICDVPEFTDILIHCGVHHGHTAGCLLVGEWPVIEPNRIGSITESPLAYEKFYKSVISAAKYDNLFIQFVDWDR